MDRISTFNTYSSVVSSLMNNEIQQSQLAAQVSSGFVASDLKGFGANAEALTAAQKLPPVCRDLASCTWGEVNAVHIMHPLSAALPHLQRQRLQCRRRPAP